MVFLKKIELRVAKDKYGGEQSGLFALEPIKKDELVWYCECSAKDESWTRAQLLEKIEQEPQLDYFLRSFSYMIDDDLYGLPVTFMKQQNNDECAYFNHSCSPNVGFSDCASTIGDKLMACRDISVGEELSCHYGFLETEASLIYNMECKCGSSNCVGRLTFDYYRDPAFVTNYFKYMTIYLQRKVKDMETRWYSSNCYVKRYKSTASTTSISLVSQRRSSLSSSASSLDTDNETMASIANPDECTFGLSSLFAITQNELVARFNSEQDFIQRKHFIRHSDNPNCYVSELKVFAKHDLPSDTELTVNYPSELL